MQDEGLMNTVKEEEILTADSGESTAGEDDFNPFGNSGSEDEGNVLSTLYLSLKKIQESGYDLYSLEPPRLFCLKPI